MSVNEARIAHNILIATFFFIGALVRRFENLVLIMTNIPIYLSVKFEMFILIIALSTKMYVLRFCMY